MATRYVIRSMTTTNFDGRAGSIRPYHIYLLPREKRFGAYWSTVGAMTFDSPQEAEAEAARSLPDSDRVNIVPERDQDIPTFWELQELARNRRAA
jgi:hypothetical protein